ncbi:MAG: hypothetical protein RIQ79_1448, partial [Verrucomicrobiota bacterium]
MYMIRIWLALFLVCAVLAGATPPDASRVVILANSTDPESIELAKYYAGKRGVPSDRIIVLKMSSDEEITWPEFVSTIWNPLLHAGISGRWIDAVTSEKNDAYGRLKIASSGHSIEALVVCRGVPLRIAHSKTLFNEDSTPLNRNAAFRNNGAAVDSELALLAMASTPIDAFIPNPFLADNPDEAALANQIIPVGRLDGPTLADAKGLVDRAIIAEHTGLCGRAYIDLGGGPVNEGNLWLEGVAPALSGLGFEIDIDRDPKTLSVASRFDAPVLYFGWYEWNANGPFTSPSFRFPVGAVALHIHSFSAATLRSGDRNWAGPFVSHGVTATVGNVAEPYLGLTHQPQLFAAALVRGEPLGRAALYSIKALSWQGVVIGDPLYRPFVTSAEKQWERRAELGSVAETYARIRQMRLLSAAGDIKGALALGSAGMKQTPSLPLALTQAELLLAASDAPEARRTLGVFARLPSWREVDRPLIL